MPLTVIELPGDVIVEFVFMVIFYKIGTGKNACQEKN